MLTIAGSQASAVRSCRTAPSSCWASCSLNALFTLPFAYYRSFFVEAQHGFNRMSRALFFGDWAEEHAAVARVRVHPELRGVLLVRELPGSFWLWVWLVLVAFSLFVTFVSPYLIEPLFFRMEPVKR